MGDQNTEDNYRSFLESFCRDHSGPVGPEDSLPFRQHNYYLSEAEAEGECLDVAQQYLTLFGCPHLLAAHIARSTAQHVLTSDLTQYYDPPDEDASDKEENQETKQKDAESNSSTVTEMDAERFAKGVVSEVHETCTRWQSNLPKLHVSKQMQVSCHAIKNTRRKMEDRHVSAPDLNILFGLPPSPSQSYFAVFDGHGGLDAAVYAASHLHVNLVHQSNFTDDPAEALKGAFLETDNGFTTKAQRESLKSGTTGVCTLIRDRALYVGWLGDSQVLLIRDGLPVTLMSPHKPEREDEKERIEKLGGCVVWFGAWRVNGSLSVSRAIGDIEHKPYICATPDIASFDLNGSEDYLVLGCDGLWDTVDPEQVPLIVYDYLQEPGSSREKVAHKLVNVARDEGSNDNISVIVVFLKDEITKPKMVTVTEGCAVVQISTTGESSTEEQDDGTVNGSEKARENQDSANQNESVSGVTKNENDITQQNQTSAQNS